MKRKSLVIAMAVGLGVSSLTGCMGQMATTGLVTKFNLEVVDNRYGREGLFLLLSPVYGIASIVDLFIVNAVEFWTGTNPISGKSPAVVDRPADTMLKVNDKLDSSMTETPLGNNSEIKDTNWKKIDDNTIEMDVTYLDGQQKTLRGKKTEDGVTFYVNNEYVTTVSNMELENYVQTTQL
ncbi:DUF3332 domain-containing protein [Vibrio fluvialis]|uniref:DUF3332 domain-containing protein n=1 Tax=Vibrio fluvialis TaxID=676 RepID=UPI0006486D17|nr:DUF3332 domain-containing protein [Vibrio fluvialis]EKO3436252.1 DUF3332 domain-containing protein [Vibrio fluvialis]EKO3553047.1 DUF3332 domain-containing protein [Vibrio fluvialis]EKO5148878.1 DUF3332 domain-containing protein [Vibrio fluvialis]ELI5737978.1 DUF3332 domain-containing protein [Vibrio fluvialis]MBY7855018.1 DUF3332 domain-containing protein [Vibrio fluvialis]